MFATRKYGDYVYIDFIFLTLAALMLSGGEPFVQFGRENYWVFACIYFEFGPVLIKKM